ncbi:hypothetical protein BJP37_21140 [Moorena bouillonii PNG]|uniref:Uncharacterized protein n=1 Tax=Moorena bouillonii PNG TaxID=568701 RepID=A0A1U7N5E3_9CYAN|nr:hypothetical protein BJP37_21140 [Moorena bouillonii PNG]
MLLVVVFWFIYYYRASLIARRYTISVRDQGTGNREQGTGNSLPRNEPLFGQKLVNPKGI